VARKDFAAALLAGVTALWGAAPQGALAQQALSKSMVECAVIYEEIVILGRSKGRKEQEITRFRDGSASFLKAAGAQARAENQPDPGKYILQLQNALQEKWSGRFSSVLTVTENKDWIDYCKAFGRERGLLPR
jgi:hypothetical protein